MSLAELKEKFTAFSKTPAFYIALAVIVVAVIYLAYRNNTKKKVITELEKYQIKLNSLKSVPLPYKVSRALALARVNKDLDETVSTCQGKFDTIQTNLKTLTEKLGDSDEFVQLRKYNMAKQNNAEIGVLISETENTVQELDTALNGILEKENIQREKINDLKEIYHGIKLNINKSPDRFLFCWEALDQMINGIDHKFSEFETIMAASEFDKAPAKMDEIKESIDNLNNVIETIPELINVAKSEVPAMVEEVQNAYVLTKKQGAYLEHLDVNRNLELINASLQDDLKRIKRCEVNEVNEHLGECEKRLNQLSQQIEKEGKAYEELLKMKDTTNENLNNLNDLAESINANFEKLTERYGMDSYSEVIEVNNQKVKELNEECHILMNSLQENNTPASVALRNLTQMNTEITVCLNNINKMSETVRNASYDEQSAREQLTKLSIVLSDVKSKIRNSRLPSISEQYESDLVKAEDYMTKLEALLKENPINVSLVNSLKSSSVDLVYQLYESVNRIIGTAMTAEKVIVIGNMYRSSYPEIDSELTRAELAYRNGEYTQALTIAFNSIRKVHPETVDNLIEGIKKVTA